MTVNNELNTFISIKYLLVIILHLFFINTILAGTPIKQIPNLQSITFYERTGSLLSHTFGPDSYELNHKFNGHMNFTNNDFQGWVGEEFFDVFISDADGSINVNGEYITVEASFHLSGVGGGLNISEVALNFLNGQSQYGSYIASFQALGNTYKQSSEKYGADCDLNTHTTMGFTTLSDQKKLRITIGFSIREYQINYTGCENDGYSIVVNGKIYNKDNPKGTEIIKTNNGCDSIIHINLHFNEVKYNSIVYTGCQGDGYYIKVNGITYNETNPTGIEFLLTPSGCDSIVNILLTFNKTYFYPIEHTECSGSNYSINVNGNTYNEAHPSGMEFMKTKSGCDSIIFVNLEFFDKYILDKNYQGCLNDGFKISVNGKIYDQNNPKGTELVLSQTGCDTIFNINLVFNAHDSTYIKHDGCMGDGYFVEVNGNTYKEGKNKGIEYLSNQYGCDSIIIINLIYKDCVKIYDELCRINIPNIFSPDNNGINDNFFLDFNPLCEITEFQISIFDRWGNKMFYSRDKNFHWDGKKDNVDLCTGVYTYVIRYKHQYGSEKIFGGDITLIR